MILVYMIASTVLVLSAGRLSDQFGRKKAYIGGFVVFALASLGAGFATSGTRADPVADRCRAIGGAFLFANSAAIVTDAFPAQPAGPGDGHQHDGRGGRAWSSDPVLGGALVLISWHWVFWFNVPFALARQPLGVARSCAS